MLAGPNLILLNVCEDSVSSPQGNKCASPLLCCYSENSDMSVPFDLFLKASTASTYIH